MRISLEQGSRAPPATDLARRCQGVHRARHISIGNKGAPTSEARRHTDQMSTKPPSRRKLLSTSQAQIASTDQEGTASVAMLPCSMA